MIRRKQAVLALAAIGLATAAFIAGALVFRKPAQGPPAGQAAGGRRILYYRSPMDPKVTSPSPKKDPMGMDYVPVYADEAGQPRDAGPNAVRIDPRVTQEVGVTTEKAELRQLSRTVRTVGMVRPDERRLHDITVKVPGWIERLYVAFMGDYVERGEPLVDLYSPELVATQQEFLLALRYARSLGPETSPHTRARAEGLVQSARRRLLLWDITGSQIDELARRGRPTRLMTLHAPASGLVIEKEVIAGSQVQPGMVLMRIADLREVWVFAQIYPNQLPWISLGQQAEIQVPGVQGRALRGRVNYIQPVVSPEARTVEVRIQVSQPDNGVVLKPNMYSDVAIQSAVRYETLAISEQSIIRSGERNIAVVALGDGYFEPRELDLGVTAGGYVEILDGIKEGEEVVTSAQFLIDSESNLRTAFGAMGGGHAGHTGAPTDGASGQPEQQPPLPSGEDAGHHHGSGDDG